MLLQLMGISLATDDLPGEAIEIPSDKILATEDTQIFVHGTLEDDFGLSSGEYPDETLRERSSLHRVRKVFDQLSNNTGERYLYIVTLLY